MTAALTAALTAPTIEGHHMRDDHTADHVADARTSDARASEALDTVREGLTAPAVSSAMVARTVAEHTGRKWFLFAIVGAVCAAITAGTVTSIVAVRISLGTSERVDAQQAQINALREAAEDAKPAGEAANRELEARGQHAVPIPEPGQGEDTDVLVSSVTARVLARLPDPTPTAGELGSVVAEVLRADPGLVQVPATAVAAALGRYLAANPPPRGPPGAAGQDGADGAAGADGQDGAAGPTGPPPTAADIEAAFTDFIATHPDYLPGALCRTTGPWTRVELRAADGGVVTAYQCVVSSAPATPDPPTDPPTDPPAEPASPPPVPGPEPPATETSSTEPPATASPTGSSATEPGG
jgi:hypothetical protein